MKASSSSEPLGNQISKLLCCITTGVTLGLIWLIPQSLRAEPPSNEIPQGLLLNPAPNFSKWTVSYVYAADLKKDVKPPLGSAPRQTITTKTQQIIREESVAVNGLRSELWHVGKIQYRQPLGEKTWFESSPPSVSNGATSYYDPLPANGFRDWEWIDKDSYAGTVTIQEVKFFVFVPGGFAKLGLTDSSQLNERLALQPLLAYVNADTKLPHALRMGDIVRHYQFLEPPTSVQALQPDLNDLIQKGEEARRRLHAPAPRPY